MKIKLLILLMLLPAIAFGQFVTPSAGGGANDSIGVDADDDGTFEAYLYPSFLQKGANITFTVAGDTLTIAGPASGGTADSMGVDTDGDGTVDNYLYSTTAGAFHIKKGSNITLSVAGDTVTVAGPSASGTADSMGVDTNGDGTIDNYLYSTVAGAFHLQEKTGMILVVLGDTVALSTTLGTSISNTEMASSDHGQMSWDGIGAGTVTDFTLDATADGGGNPIINIDSLDALIIRATDSLIVGTDAITDITGNGMVITAGALEIDTVAGIRPADNSTLPVSSNQVYDFVADTLGNYIDSASVHDSLDVMRVEMGDSARVAAGDSARVVKLNEVNNPDGSKTFGMGAFGLKYLWTGTVATAWELEATGVYTGDLMHVHQHTGNVGATNLVTFEATDINVITLRVDHAGRDTLSIFSGGLSVFDSVSVNGLLTGDSAQFDGNVDIDSMDVNGAADFAGPSTFTNIVDVQGDTLRADTVLIDNELVIPNGTNPTVGQEAGIAHDTDDNNLRGYDGSVEFVYAGKLKYFTQTIEQPDSIQAHNDFVTVLSCEEEYAPFGIKIVDVGIKTKVSSSYSVDFEYWTHPCADSGTESLIETVATSTTCTAKDDGTITNSDIAIGGVLIVDLPTTDVEEVQVWGTFYIKTGD